MKKIVGIITLFSILLVTGCGKSKTLTCTYDLGTEEVKTSMEYKLVFDKDGKKLSSYEEKDTTEYLDSDEELEEVYQSSLKNCNDINELKGVECSIEKNDKTVTMNLKVKLSDLDSEGKDTLFTREAEEKNYDEFKSMMEQTGFICK